MLGLAVVLCAAAALGVLLVTSLVILQMLDEPPPAAIEGPVGSNAATPDHPVLIGAGPLCSTKAEVIWLPQPLLFLHERNYYVARQARFG